MINYSNAPWSSRPQTGQYPAALISSVSSSLSKYLQTARIFSHFPRCLRKKRRRWISYLIFSSLVSGHLISNHQSNSAEYTLWQRSNSFPGRSDCRTYLLAGIQMRERGKKVVGNRDRGVLIPDSRFIISV